MYPLIQQTYSSSSSSSSLLFFLSSSLPPILPSPSLPLSAGLLKVTNTTLSPCFGNPEVVAMNGNLKDIGNAFGVVDHTVSRIRRRSRRRRRMMLLHIHANHATIEHNTTASYLSSLVLC